MLISHEVKTVCDISIWETTVQVVYFSTYEQDSDVTMSTYELILMPNEKNSVKTGCNISSYETTVLRQVVMSQSMN